MATRRCARRRSTRLRRTAWCSSARTRTRRRRCRPTRHSCRDASRSRRASATTSGSPSSRPNACYPRCCATAAMPPRASFRRSCCARKRASARGSTCSTPRYRRPGSRRASARCSATARSLRPLPSTGSIRTDRDGRSSSCISTSHTSRTRRPSASRNTRRTTARLPTAMRSSGNSCTISSRISCTTVPRSCCCRITVRALATTASGSTDFSSTTRRFTSRSSSSRKATSAPGAGWRSWSSTSTSCRRFSI